MENRFSFDFITFIGNLSKLFLDDIYCFNNQLCFYIYLLYAENVSLF